MTDKEFIRNVKYVQESLCSEHEWDYTYWINAIGQKTQSYWDSTAHLKICKNCGQRRVELFDEDGW